MKEKIKKYQYSILVITLLVIAGFAFYWYEWKPNRIRIKCNDSAFNSSMEAFDESSKTESGRMTLKEKFYKDCLRYNGLEK